MHAERDIILQGDHGLCAYPVNRVRTAIQEHAVYVPHAILDMTHLDTNQHLVRNVSRAYTRLRRALHNVPIAL